MSNSSSSWDKGTLSTKYRAPPRGSVAELVSRTPASASPEIYQKYFPEKPGIFPRSSSRGISLTPQALQLLLTCLAR